MFKLRLKVVGATVLVIAVAATGAGWKWAASHPRGKKGAGHVHRVAGWTWDGAVSDRGVD